MEYVEAAVTAPLPSSLVYSLPEEMAPLAQPGKRVLVPLGKRRVTGYILGPAEKPEGFRARPILDVLDHEPLFHQSMIPFFRWISSYYLHPIGEVIKEALPSGVNAVETVVVSLLPEGEKALETGSLSLSQARILAVLKEKGSCPQTELLKSAGKKTSTSPILTLHRKGFIDVKRVMKTGRVRPRSETWLKGLLSKSNASPRQKTRHAVLDILNNSGAMSLRDLRRLAPSASRWISEMEESGEIEVFEKEVYRDPFGEPIEPDEERVTLTSEQSEAYERISRLTGNGFRSTLLHGVTGCGKTEVYLRCVEKALEKGLSSIILVPEIALISQIQRQFLARFGDRVGVLHSGLSDGERLDQWMRIARGEAPIAIGARSAIFAPVENLGLVIVDEEHDESYKQDNRLKYHARDLAVLRCSQENAVAVLGSATPSLSSHFNCVKGKFEKVSITKRVAERPFPHVELVDLRKAVRGKNGSLITEVLKTRISETLGRGEQALLFLNRRGFSNFPVCLNCGKTVSCPNCDISLTFHKFDSSYQCHYCGFAWDHARGCPACSSRDVKLTGMGTEKVEESLQAMFPGASVARLDRDVVSRKGALVSVLKGLRENNTDILIGTQMVAKGHDFHNITLVGIICADLSMGFPDFRAGERTFQLLAQVAGRAGRGEKPGRVVLQTYNPDHFCIATACNGDYQAFCQKELRFRQQLKYPPFSRLAQIRFTGEDKKKTQGFALKMGEELRKLQWADKGFKNSIQILGPIPAPIGRIAGQYRWQMLLKGLDFKLFRSFLAMADRTLKDSSSSSGPGAVIDIDPVNML